MCTHPVSFLPPLSGLMLRGLMTFSLLKCNEFVTPNTSASHSYGTPSSTCKQFLPFPFPRFLFRFTNLVSEVKVKVHQLFLYCSSLFLIIIFLSLFLSSLSHPTSYLSFVIFFHRRTISLLNFFPAMICRTVDNHVASPVS